MLMSSEYREWLHDLKFQIKRAQLRTAVSVNCQLIMLYWDLGRQIIEKQENSKWGSGLIDQLSKDLQNEFPNMKGFSRANLFRIQKFFKFYSPIIKSNQNELVAHHVRLSKNEESELVANHVRQLYLHKNQQDDKAEYILPIFAMIPWGHNITIIENLVDLSEVIYYITKCMENNWSRSELENNIKTNYINRQGKAITNFTYTLPELESNLAKEIIKSEYNFSFLKMSDNAKETDIEKALVLHMAQFLTELGKGFAYMGRQYPIKVGSKEFKIDLLFYHTKLKCYIVIELKVREFDPDFTGKLVFYVTAVDELVKDENDNPTIGILLCKDKDDIVVDFALKNIKSPLGVGKMQYTELAEEIKAVLPSLTELQEELLLFSKAQTNENQSNNNES